MVAASNVTIRLRIRLFLKSRHHRRFG